VRRDDLTAICEPQRLTTPLASKACLSASRGPSSGRHELTGGKCSLLLQIPTPLSLSLSWTTPPQYPTCSHSQGQGYITTDSQSVCLGVEPNLGLLTRDIFFLKSLSCHLGAPSLTRGRVCHLSVFCQYSLK
jgi:hypothetical protein